MGFFSAFSLPGIYVSHTVGRSSARRATAREECAKTFRGERREDEECFFQPVGGLSFAVKTNAACTVQVLILNFQIEMS